MNYTEVTFEVGNREEGERLIAFLSEEGYEMFEEDDRALKAYIPDYIFRDSAVKKIIDEFFSGNLIYSAKKIADENWNIEWEKNFQPVLIDGVFIRAPFHPPSPSSRFELVIEPKMSFGTGHHATTTLMVKKILKLDLQGKDVLDMGCGTSVLAMLASKLGANKILAIDVDEWAIENSVENVHRNGIDNVRIRKGDASVLKGHEFHVVIANINRNILLADIPAYAGCLLSGGDLLLSGFYEDDVNRIRDVAEKNGLTFINHNVLNHWVVLHFSKS